MPSFPGKNASSVKSAPKKLQTSVPAAKMPGAAQAGAFFDGPKNLPMSSPKGLRNAPKAKKV